MIDVTSCHSVQDAIDGLGAAGGVVELGPGKWEPRDTWRLPKRVTLRGCGRNCTIIEPQHTGAVIELTESGGQRVGDLWIDPKSYTPVIGIKIHVDAHEWRIENVRVYDCNIGISVDGYCTYSEIYNVRLNKCAIGIKLANGCRRVDVTECRFNGGTTGLLLEGSVGTSPQGPVADCLVQRCGFEGLDTGIETIAEENNDVYQCRSAHCRFENCVDAMKIGANTKRWRYCDHFFTGNSSNLNDSGAQTAEGWL